MNWTDNKRWGPPDAPGMYLCAFSDGTIETFPLGEDEVELEDCTFWRVPGFKGTIITHWAELPKHPGER